MIRSFTEEGTRAGLRSLTERPFRTCGHTILEPVADRLSRTNCQAVASLAGQETDQFTCSDQEEAEDDPVCLEPLVLCGCTSPSLQVLHSLLHGWRPNRTRGNHSVKCHPGCSFADEGSVLPQPQVDKSPIDQPAEPAPELPHEFPKCSLGHEPPAPDASPSGSSPLSSLPWESPNKFPGSSTGANTPHQRPENDEPSGEDVDPTGTGLHDDRRLQRARETEEQALDFVSGYRRIHGQTDPTRDRLGLQTAPAGRGAGLSGLQEGSCGSSPRLHAQAWCEGEATAQAVWDGCRLSPAPAAW
jgi:hypothetical protein